MKLLSMKRKLRNQGGLRIIEYHGESMLMNISGPTPGGGEAFIDNVRILKNSDGILFTFCPRCGEFVRLENDYSGHCDNCSADIVKN